MYQYNQYEQWHYIVIADMTAKNQFFWTSYLSLDMKEFMLSEMAIFLRFSTGAGAKQNLHTREGGRM